MKSNDFQDNLHHSPKKEENRTRVIPFERKVKKDHLSPNNTDPKADTASQARIIAFPSCCPKIRTTKSWLPFLRSAFRMCGGWYGLLILLLILTLVFYL